MYNSLHNNLQACQTLWRYTAEAVYLQHGGIYYCRQNDVTVTPVSDTLITFVTELLVIDETQKWQTQCFRPVAERYCRAKDTDGATPPSDEH